MFVSAWIDNAPNERHDSGEGGRDIKKTSLGRGKNGPRSGPLSTMYFGNDIILNSRHRSTRESWEPDNRQSLWTLTDDEVNAREEPELSTGRRSATSSSPVLSRKGLTDKSSSFQRAKREASGPSQTARESPRSPKRNTQAHKRSTIATHDDLPEHNILLREREIFLRDRALFLRERESFLNEKQRFHTEMDALLQKRGDSKKQTTADTIISASKSSGTVPTRHVLSSAIIPRYLSLSIYLSIYLPIHLHSPPLFNLTIFIRQSRSFTLSFPPKLSPSLLFSISPHPPISSLASFPPPLVSLSKGLEGEGQMHGG